MNLEEKKNQKPTCLLDIHIAVDRATALPSTFNRITLDAKLAARGSGPTICWAASPAPAHLLARFF
jgi:hypothetical protein